MMISCAKCFKRIEMGVVLDLSDEVVSKLILG